MRFGEMEYKYMFHVFALLFAVMPFATMSGCNNNWHSNLNWNAEDYFDDPKVIALCKAIQAQNIVKIDKLVAEGADVNARGKGNMTPLLWAFPGNNLNAFKRLLEHGADPNVEITEELNPMGVPSHGNSVLHLAARTKFPHYFKYVRTNCGTEKNLCRRIGSEKESQGSETVKNQGIRNMLPTQTCNSFSRFGIAIGNAGCGFKNAPKYNDMGWHFFGFTGDQFRRNV